MTQFRSSGTSAHELREPASSDTAARLNKRVSGLRITVLAATIMLLIQIGLGYAVAQAVNVPAADHGAGVFVAIGRALANGPVALTVHAALGLLLLITATSAIIRSVLARRMTVLAICVVGLAALVTANVTGASFTGSNQDADSTAMSVSGVVALACYLLCLLLLLRKRARR